MDRNTNAHPKRLSRVGEVIARIIADSRIRDMLVDVQNTATFEAFIRA